MRVLERKELYAGSSESRISFLTQGGGAWPVWDRYLSVDGKRAYHLGNICQTCQFLFQRLEGANTSVQIDGTAEALKVGVAALSDLVVEQVGAGLPEGDYIATLADITLERTRPGEQNDYFVKEQIALYGTDSFWDLPHDPRVPYYRAGRRTISNASALFQFVVPMFPESWLKPEVIAAYTSELDEGKHPTAVAISLLDVKGPADRGEEGNSVHEHWALTHFLIDGHHKAAAARRKGTRLRLLSYIALKEGISERAQVDTALASFEHLSDIEAVSN